MRVNVPVNNQRVFWDRREDSFRRDANGNLTWLQATGGHNRIKMFKFEM